MLLTSIPPLTEALGPTDSIESCITQYATFSIPAHDGKRVCVVMILKAMYKNETTKIIFQISLPLFPRKELVWIFII